MADIFLLYISCITPFIVFSLDKINIPSHYDSPIFQIT